MKIKNPKSKIENPRILRRMTTMHATPSGLRGRVLIVALSLMCALAIGRAQTPPASGDGPATQGTGLIRNDPGAYQGYTLLSPLSSQTTYLIDMAGRIVKEWNAGSTPSSIATVASAS